MNKIKYLILTVLVIFILSCKKYEDEKPVSSTKATTKLSEEKQLVVDQYVQIEHHSSGFIFQIFKGNLTPNQTMYIGKSLYSVMYVEDHVYPNSFYRIIKVKEY